MPDEKTGIDAPIQNGNPSPNWGNIMLGGVKLDWIRAAIFKVGGRKAALALGAGYVIREILSKGIDWPHVAACGVIAFIAVGIGFAIAWEDSAKAKATK